MKKIMSIVLVLIMIVSLSACSGAGKSTTTAGKQETKAKIVNNNGVTEYLTAQELMDLDDENELAFDNDYWCAKATVTGTITELSGARIINGTYYDWTIVVDGVWFVGKGKYTETSVTEDFIATLRKGDVVTISGEIVGAGFGEVDISNGTVSVTKN